MRAKEALQRAFNLDIKVTDDSTVEVKGDNHTTQKVRLFRVGRVELRRAKGEVKWTVVACDVLHVRARLAEAIVAAIEMELWFRRILAHGWEG